MSYFDGSIYIGDWQNELKEGNGSYYFSDERKYYGAFKND